MKPYAAASPSGGSPESPIEVVTPTPIRNDTRGFQSAPTTLSTSFIHIKKQFERTNVEHKAAPPTPLASKNSWKSDINTTITSDESFSATKRKYEENRAVSSRPSQDGSSPQRYKETPVPPPQLRVHNLARYETYTPRTPIDADPTSDETPLPKRTPTARTAWKPRTENTAYYDLIAPNPVCPPAPGCSPLQRYKETPVPPPQPRQHNPARYEGTE